MKLNEIRDNAGATHSRKVLGRGIGSGKGKTSGKGHKGQKARGTGKVRPQFEGGQNPIYRRTPKRGFTNIFKHNYFIISVGALSEYIDSKKIDLSNTITHEYLKETKVLKGVYDGVRILGNGKLKHAIKIQVHGVSKGAEEQIKAKGGSIDILEHKKFINKKKEFSTK